MYHWLHLIVVVVITFNKVVASIKQVALRNGYRVLPPHNPAREEKKMRVFVLLLHNSVHACKQRYEEWDVPAIAAKSVKGNPVIISHNKS